jgi:hypothetical protein
MRGHETEGTMDRGDETEEKGGKNPKRETRDEREVSMKGLFAKLFQNCFFIETDRHFSCPSSSNFSSLFLVPRQREE